MMMMVMIFLFNRKKKESQKRQLTGGKCRRVYAYIIIIKEMSILFRFFRFKSAELFFLALFIELTITPSAYNVDDKNMNESHKYMIVLKLHENMNTIIHIK